MKRRVFLLATLALVGVVAFAVRDLVSLSRSDDFETVQAMLALRTTQVQSRPLRCTGSSRPDPAIGALATSRPFRRRGVCRA